MNAKDDRGMTALHWASCSAAAEALIAAGADVHSASDDGLTPLHLAVDVPIARVLVKAGAKLEAADRCGNRPLHTASYFGLSFDKSAAPSPGGSKDDLSSAPLWVRVLVKSIAELAVQMDRITQLFDVHGTLVELGADRSAINQSGLASSSIAQMGSRGGDD